MKISPLFKKLNLKDQGTIFVIDAPATFRAELARLEGVDIEPTLARATGGVTFLLAFVTRTPQIEAVASKLTRIAPQLAELGIARAWACLRTFSETRQPVVDWDATRPWLLWVAGLGGHGATASAAIGEAAAAKLLARV